jgi:hypothetical protein
LAAWLAEHHCRRLDGSVGFFNECKVIGQIETISGILEITDHRLEFDNVKDSETKEYYSEDYIEYIVNNQGADMSTLAAATIYTEY